MIYKGLNAIPNKILVIRRDNIGDLVCTTPAIAALRQRYPKAQIGALVNSYNAEVLNGNRNLDFVFVYQKLKHASGIYQILKALLQRLMLVIKIRNWKPDVTILAKSSYDRHGLTLARQIGAKNIIGFIPDDINNIKWLPDIRIKTPDLTEVHEVEAINELLVPLFVNDAHGHLQVFPDADVTERIRKTLPTAVKRIAVHISAREKERRWGIENFTALINVLLNEYKEMQVMLLWSPGKADDQQHPGDDAAAVAIANEVESNKLILMPTQNLAELIATLSLCDVFVGADGGALHLAVALNKRVLGMYENTSGKLNHWYPWKVRNAIVHSRSIDNPNVCGIEIESVINAFKKLIR